MTDKPMKSGGKPPKIVYKFRPWNLDKKEDRYIRAKSIISERKIFFSSPCQFNDPFDMNIPPDYSEMTPNEWIQKYVEVGEYGIRSGQQSQEEVNKAMERDLYRKPIWFDPDKLSDFGFRMLNDFRSVAGVFCTSGRYSNILQWTHYSENHTGIAIGFESNGLWEDTNSSYGKVIYNEGLKQPIIKPNVGKRIEDIIQIFNHKAPFWKYESEVRFFKLVMEDYQRVSTIRPETIKEIILGCEMEFNMKRRTYEFIRKFNELDHVRILSSHRNPNYFYCRVRDYDYKNNY